MRVRVFYHDKCFDGACSASLFTRFHRECIDSEAAYEYHGLVHRAGALFDESEFTGDENAIVDFKYSASPKITWWFDHHLSAFLTPEDHQHFLACQKDPICGARKFFDPDYTSCTSFLGYIGSTKFGFDTAPGYRVGLTHSLSDCSSLQVNYTWFQDSTHDSITATSGCFKPARAPARRPRRPGARRR